MPRISSGVLTGVATTTAFAPILMLFPSVQERIGMQAAKWGPRWQRGFARITPHVERHIQKLQPPLSKTAKAVEPPLKRAALVDKNMKRAFSAWPKQ